MSSSKLRGDDQLGKLPPALPAMWRLCKLGYQHEPTLMGWALGLTLLAALPILFLLGLLATGRVSAQMAALAGLAVAIVAAIVERVAIVAWHRLLLRLALAELFLGRCDQAEIVLGVLEIVLRRDGIAAGVGVTGELKIFLGDVMRVAPDFHVRTVGLVGTRERVGATPVV